MWTFHLPTKIHFGLNVAASLSELPEIRGRRVAIVSDSVVCNIPEIRRLIEKTAPAVLFDKVRPNPTTVNVDEFAQLLRESQAETVLAIGGGSSMDTAKAAANLAVTTDASIRAYHSEGKQFSQKPIPVVAVPTTAGTGAEVTSIAVLDDEEKNFKSPMSSPFFYPVCAAVDPALTFSLPIYATAATALDALSHAIEGYWSKQRQPICDALAKEAARIIFAHLSEVYDNPKSAIGREALSYAALTAGIAFHLPKNAMIHACSFPLSNRLHLSHGAACAFTMEEAIRFNAPAMNGRMEEFAKHCGFDEIETMIQTIASLKRRGGLPCTWREAGIDSSLAETLIRESFHPLMNNNPRPVTENDLRKIYAKFDEQ
ncbi:MAG: iron-containing alcohol dehydrogenase [Planctomycetaceae bacterium]|jgi:alcohol dehydrogenase|nr:iron-containing alcohol dehydrogenase [Planctomycetaceae bacterium]